MLLLCKVTAVCRLALYQHEHPPIHYMHSAIKLHFSCNILRQQNHGKHLLKCSCYNFAVKMTAYCSKIDFEYFLSPLQENK